MFVAGTEPDGKEWHALACLASAGTTDRFISELRNVAKMHPSGPSKFSFYLILEAPCLLLISPRFLAM